MPPAEGGGMEIFMIKEYATVNEKAKEWEITTRTVQSMCVDGRIPGAVKFCKV